MSTDTIDNVAGKKILILGAGTWLAPHIEKANELGLKTYVTDWSDNAEGKKYAHVFEPISLRDKEGTLAFAKKHSVDAIYTSADIGVQTAAYVASRMGLIYHDLDLAVNATNKRKMRQKAKEIGIPIPRFFSTDNINEAKASAKTFGYPVIIKPVDNCSSRGVSVIYNEEELEHIFDESISTSYEGKILIEEFMTGTEGSVEALVQNNKVYIMGVCDKEKSKLPYRYDLQMNYPGNYSETQYKKIELFIDKLVKGYGIKNGIIHVEFIIDGDTVKLIEFGIRGCGSKVITHLLPKMLEFDVLKFLILNSFGLEQDVSFINNGYGVLKFIMLPHGEINTISGKNEILNIEGVLDYDIERKPGDVINQIKDGRSRPGYLLAVGETKSKLKAITERVMNTISVTYK